MTKRHMTILAITTALIATPAAATTPNQSIDYYLTRTDVAVALKLTLKSCPTQADELPVIAQEWVVEAEGAADQSRLVKVDISNGFLAKRSTAFTFNANGTLSAFNSKAEGQGGAVLESVIKTAGAVAGIALGGVPLTILGLDGGEAPPLPSFVCTDAAIKKLGEIDTFGKQIRELEDRMVLAKLTAAETELLEKLRGSRTRTVKALTLVIAAPLNGEDAAHTLTSEVSLTDKLGKWFEPKSGSSASTSFDILKIDGIAGYGVSVVPAGPVPQGANAKIGEDPERLLYYRRPVLSEVKVKDLGCASELDADCTETVDLDEPLMIGQWGKIETLKIGTGGLFGTREAKAKFDEFGNPLELSYGSDSGAAGIASTIGAVGDTANSIADADIDALERAVKREQLRKKLADLKDDTAAD